MATVLFGAFDRHNFGDLLFPHIVSALLPGREPAFAGLASRDLTAFGGHRVEAVSTLQRADMPVDLIHVGGELLSCDTWEAAVMLLDPAQARSVIARHAGRPLAALRWAQRRLEIGRRAAYVLSKAALPQSSRVFFNAVGGVGLAGRDPAFRAEVVDTLGGADFVGVRDTVTREALARAGIAARLAPDPAVLVADLFGSRIRAAGERGEVAQVRAAFPRGYLAAQFSADLGDDATLDLLGAQLSELRRETGFGLVLFRAGAAPWHDDLEVCRRLARRLPGSLVFESLNVWDICALIAASAGFCGSSLHGRIVARAFALPAVSVIRDEPHAAAPGKQEAVARTWEPAGQGGVVPPPDLASAWLRDAALPADARSEAQRALARRAREEFDLLRTALG